APPSPDYMPGLEEPEQAPLSPDYIPGPEHADDKIVAEDQPYAEDTSPITQSPEYEHPAPADSVVVAPTAADQALSAEEMEPFKTDESAATPPPHPTYPPAPPPSLIRSLGYRAAMIRLREEAASTSYSPPSQLPSASRREDRPE
nr:hypothetical protein [Tanacetum cinerariifolium]